MERIYAELRCFQLHKPITDTIQETGTMVFGTLNLD